MSLIFLDIYSGVELLDHILVLFLVFFRNLHTISVCTNLHSHQQRTSALFSLRHHQHLLFVVVLMIAILTTVKLYLTRCLMCIYLLVMMSICSCVCWPFVCLLWTMSIQIFCQLFNYYFFNIELYGLFTYFGY